MSKVILVMSMSLDGFITAANRRPEEPLGDGGLQLHEWAMDTEDARNREVLTQGIASIGAVITGRRNYEDSIQWWGADGPTGPARLPVFVVSHREAKEVASNGVYQFVNSIQTAFEGAKDVAKEKDVSVMGGADIAQQCLKAGLIDEIQIHLIPVLFSEGTRLFDNLGGEHIQLENMKVVQTAAATHLRFRIVK